MAERGDKFAQQLLGIMYKYGQGVPKDLTEAARWYRLAAKQNYGFAQFDLGEMYAEEDGMPKDIVTAHMWYNISDANGNEWARRPRRLLEREMIRKQIAEAKLRAKICLASYYEDCD